LHHSIPFACAHAHPPVCLLPFPPLISASLSLPWRIFFFFASSFFLPRRGCSYMLPLGFVSLSLACFYVSLFLFLCFCV